MRKDKTRKKKPYSWWIIGILVLLGISAVVYFSMNSPQNKKEIKAEADSLMNKAVKALNDDYYTLAFHNLNTALSLYNDIEDKAGEMQVRSNMSVVYYGIGLFDEAVKELNIVNKNINLLNNDGKRMYYRCKAIIETTYKEDFPQAIKDIQEVIELERQAGHYISMIQDMANLAEIYIYAGHIDKSKETIKQIEHKVDSLEHRHSAQFYFCKGKLLFKEGNYDEAYDVLSKCTDFSTLYYQPHLKLEALNLIYQIDSMRDDKDAYIDNLKRYISLNDSLSGSQITSRIARLQEQQKIEIERETADKNHKLTLIYLAFGLIMALFLAFISFLMYRQARAQQKLVKFEADKLDSEIMMQRMRNELLQLKVDKKKEELKEIRKENLSMSLQLASIQDNNNMETFHSFDDIYLQLNETFGQQLRELHPNLTTTEQRFLCLIKLGMTSHEMMTILNISQSGIYKMRYRLKKKLGLNSDETIENYLSSIK